MIRKRIMVVAGEPSGDALAAEVIRALPEPLGAAQFDSSHDFQPLTTPFPAELFGAGGQHLAAAGVELAADTTTHSVIGIADALHHYRWFKQIFDQLLRLAIERKPHLIVLVDSAGFNLRFARAVKASVRKRRGSFNNWNPKIVYFVSPQVWASRAGRARRLAENVDLLLSIFPFEKEWYARRRPDLRVEFVGHPIIDRYAHLPPLSAPGRGAETPAFITLLPGSRPAELARHLPVMINAAKKIAARQPCRFEMILPNTRLVTQAKEFDLSALPAVQVKAGGLAEALSKAHLAIASTGTVTLECAYFGVPTVAIYKTAWATYLIGKRIVQVPFLAMPNLLAAERLYPELIQGAATPEAIAHEALDLLNNPERVQLLRTKLAHVIKSLGGPGASRRAAQAIAQILSA